MPKNRIQFQKGLSLPGFDCQKDIFGLDAMAHITQKSAQDLYINAKTASTKAA